jgi:hypothetical protein
LGLTTGASAETAMAGFNVGKANAEKLIEGGYVEDKLMG